MKRKWLKRMGAAALAATLVLAGSGIMPLGGSSGVKAADICFKQDLVVKNITEAADNTGIGIPDLVVAYKLTPDTTLAGTHNLFITDSTAYPAIGTSTTLYYNYQIDAQTLTSDKESFDVPINGFFESDSVSGDTVSTWTQQGVYAYKLQMVGIYEEKIGTGNTIEHKNDPVPGGAANLLTSPIPEFSVPTVREYECGVYVNADKEIQILILSDDLGTAVDSEDETKKYDGFLADNTRNGETNGEIVYNVYNVEVSTDYVSQSSNSAPSFSYEVLFEDLPTYLDGSDSTIVVPNGFTLDPASAATKAKFTGNITAGTPVVFKGLPVRTTPIKYTATLDYSSASNPDQYNKMIFSNANIQTVDSSVNTLAGFNTFNASLSTKYTTDNNNETTHKAVVASTVTDGTGLGDHFNNIRFVAVDVSQLAVVGVATDSKPGILMVCLALGAGFVVLRRKRVGRR